MSVDTTCISNLAPNNAIQPTRRRKRISSSTSGAID